MSTIRARFAPSPTGFLHLGGARTALFNWAYINHLRAQGKDAEFLLRIEDTDVERSTQAAIDAILQAMDWLGLDYQGEVVYQTARRSRYVEVAEAMIAQGLAYRCYASVEELEQLRAEQKARGEKQRYDRRWRHATQTPPAGVTPVIRFANPLDGVVHWHDLIKGDIAIDNAELDDFVMMRADGMPTYNFANVVDDSDQQITHIIRGDDHVNNTPKQINLYRALQLAEPQFGHLPMIHGDDGEKLSKRHGAVNVMDYREQGILPAALMNYLARLGFSHGNEEIFSQQQLAQWFDWNQVQSSPARFDRQKLLWLNQHYLQTISAEGLHDLLRRLAPEVLAQATGKINVPAFLLLYRERSHTMVELRDALHQACCEALTYTDEARQTLMTAEDVLQYMHQHLSASQDWSAAAHSSLFQACLAATGKKMGQLGVPLRVALLGQKQSPAIDKLLACFEPQWALARIAQAINLGQLAHKGLAGLTPCGGGGGVMTGGQPH